MKTKLMHYRVGTQVVAVNVIEDERFGRTNLPDGATPITRGEYDNHMRKTMVRAQERAQAARQHGTAELVQGLIDVLGVDVDGAAKLLELFVPSAPPARVRHRPEQPT
jgi:hypothetical protein